MIASYPEANPAWFRPDIESDVEVVKEVIHGARSLRYDYKIANHIKADFAFMSENEETVRIMLEQADDFTTLAKGTMVRLEGEVARGWCTKVISDSLSLLVNLAGILDVDVEINRLTKEVERLTPMIDSYRRKIAVPDYETKVPETIRITNTEKLASYEAELDATIRAKENFEAMRK